MTDYADVVKRKIRANVRRAWTGGFVIGCTIGVFAALGNWIGVAATVLGFAIVRFGIWLGMASR